MSPELTSFPNRRPKGLNYDSVANRRLHNPVNRLMKTLHAEKQPAPVTPSSWSNAQWNMPILNQGPFGSCTGHGTAQALYTTLAARNARLPWYPSMWLSYIIARMLERSPDPRTGKLPPPTDSGAMPTDLILTLSEFGTMGMVKPITDDGRFSDCDSTNINSEPNLIQLESAGMTIEVGLYAVDIGAPNLVSVLKTCIAAGISVGIPFFCDEAFENYSSSSSPLDNVDLNDPQGGGHWVSFDAYDTVSTGTVFSGPNSWDTSWGKQGRFEVTQKWVTKACDNPIPFAVGL